MNGFQMPPYNDQDPAGIKAAWQQDDQHAAGITGDLANILRAIWIGIRWVACRVASVLPR